VISEEKAMGREADSGGFGERIALYMRVSSEE
jgi:hypothetical protein